MRHVELAGTGIRSSALGFGCANLMGKVSRRQSLRALGSAFDQGITLFDTARSYGWGESEAVVGEFAQRRRDRVVLVTKFGILPPPRNRMRQVLKPIARSLLALAARFRLNKMTASIRGQIRQRVSSQVQHGQFDVKTARESVNTSLKALRTDFVDLLLLHSPTYETIADGKIIDYLEKEVRAGKARAIGVSSDAGNANQIVATFPSLKVVQLENSLVTHQIDALEHRDRIGVVTNAPFGGPSLFDRMLKLALLNPTQTGQWGAQTGIDLCSKEGIGQLLLMYAFGANPTGVVLCGMSQVKHIAQNVALATVDPLLLSNLCDVAEDIRRKVTPDPLR